MKKCVQCHKELVFAGKLIPQLMIEGTIGGMEAYYCDHPDCPNYKLLQIGE